MKIKITSNTETTTPIGTILEVIKCSCGSCKFDGTDFGFYKLISKEDKNKFRINEISSNDCEVIKTKVNHLPDWL